MKKLSANESMLNIAITETTNANEIKKLMTAAMNQPRVAKRFYVGSVSFIASIITSVEFTHSNELASFGLIGQEFPRLQVTYIE